jgi:hypothetical protein
MLSTSRIKYFEIITRLKFVRLQSLHGTINFMNIVGGIIRDSILQFHAECLKID